MPGASRDWPELRPAQWASDLVARPRPLSLTEAEIDDLADRIRRVHEETAHIRMHPAGIRTRLRWRVADLREWAYDRRARLRCWWRTW